MDFAPDPRVDLRRYEILLQLMDLMVHYGSLPEFFQKLTERLRSVADFKFIDFALHDPQRSVMRLQLWSESGQTFEEVEYPAEESLSGWVWQKQQPRVVADLETDAEFPAIRSLLLQRGVRSSCVVPLTTTQQRLGAMGINSSQPNAYSAADVEFLRRVAEMAALALENSVIRKDMEREKQRLHMLLQVSHALLSNLDMQQLFPAISENIRRVIQQDYASLAVHDESSDVLQMYALDFPLAHDVIGPNTYVPAKRGPAARAFVEVQTTIFSHDDLERQRSEFIDRMLEHGIRSLCSIPLYTSKAVLGTLNLGSKRDDAFNPQDVELLEQVAATVSIALENTRAYRKIAELKDKLTQEKLYLEDEIRSEMHFDEIVGESSALKTVLGQAKTVAPSDATVLILGETGTGKELIARAIHRMSSRRNGPFIKLNCAAIPTGLLESELFGHEKGAFTGAISQKLGRMELAHSGTLFLDEIGDIPLELQPKLLRVLQDHEFEHLGGTRTIRVNVRLVAATNRDLARSVADREFRSDLFYRLNVFPIRIPPLRERVSDVPLLVRYFVQKISRHMNKRIESIPTEAMTALVNWSWPGNVRELENFMERSVILSDDDVLRVPLAELKLAAEGESPDMTRNLESMERHHIIRVLRETGGVIGGVAGAAARLGLKRTTLQSRMQKLGIARADYEN